MGAARPASIGRVHLWLSAQSVILVLASVNRLTDLTAGYVATNEFLRWVDLLNMLAFPLASVLALWLVKREVERNRPASGAGGRLALELAFLTGLYLLAASYGTHEVTNYLHVRFCLDGRDDIVCRIVAFNDDEFSHWVFFTGFVAVNGSLMLLQASHPFADVRPRALDLALLALNGAFIALALFANLAFEEIGLDLYVVALLAALAFGLLWRRGAQPLFVYYAVAYGLGLALTVGYRVLN